MARLDKLPVYTGTNDGICIYQLRGQFYMRTKSSLSADRVKKAPEFEQTRIYASLLGRASKLGSQLYKTFSEKKKKKFSSQFLTGQAMKMLKSGLEENDVVNMLRDRF